MAYKFKVGDKVKRTTGDDYLNMKIGDTGIVYSMMSCGHINIRGFKTDGSNGTYHESYYTLIKSGKAKKEVPAKFLLQYEIDEDPFEEFQTLTAVKKRIKELVKEGGHSFVLWEIKKKTILDVEKVENVIIKGI